MRAQHRAVNQSRRGVIFSVVAVLLLLTNCGETAGRAKRKRCMDVKNEWRSKGFGDNQQVPSSPVPGVDLSVCEAWPRGSRSRGGSRTLVTCCTRQMEARLTTHARHELSRLLTSKLNDVRHDFSNADSDFENLSMELIDSSGRELHDMFTRTYGILYQQNSQVFSELFHNLRTYFHGSTMNLDHVLNGFFSSLLLRMFTLLNGQYVFDQRYLGCISDRASDLEPFGDVPQKLNVQVKRALIAARMFHQGLQTGAEVVSALSRLAVDGECERTVTKMLYCPYCRGLVSAKPCSTYCNEVMTSCLAGHASSTQFTEAWNDFVDAMMMVADRLEGPFNIDDVLDPMDVKISEAIMNFQENAEAVTAKVFQMCGQPSLGVRSRRAVSRRNRGEGRRRGQGEGRRHGDRGRRRRRTTPSFLDGVEVLPEQHGRITHVPQSTTPTSWFTSSLPQSSASLGGGLEMNVTVGENHTEEHILTTTSPSATSSSLPSTTDSRPRRTRRPRRNRNRGSRRRKNQRTSTPAMRMTTEPLFYPDSGQHPLWGIEHRRQQQHREEGSMSQLGRLIKEIRSKLTMNRDLVTHLPRSLCSTLTGISERRCWNGTSYTRSNRSQHAVGEVDTNDRDVTHWQNTDTAVSRLIARLKDVTDKLQNAYNGLDVSRSSAGQYGE